MAQSNLPFVYDVRAAGEADVADLRRMRLALQAHFIRANPHLLTLSAQRVAALATFYQDLLADPQAQVLVAQERQSTRRVGMTIGRIVRHEEFEPAVWGQIDDVWVEPEYRQHGVCRALLTRLLEFFEQARVEMLVLDYVKGNREAEGVWRRCGFQEVLTVANANIEEVKKSLKK